MHHRQEYKTYTRSIVANAENGYLEKFEVVDAARGGKIKVMLSGKINSCKVIVPRFFVKKDEYERWEKQYLPASGSESCWYRHQKALFA